MLHVFFSVVVLQDLKIYCKVGEDVFGTVSNVSADSRSIVVYEVVVGGRHSMSEGIPSSALHIQNMLYCRVIIVVTLKCNGGMTLYVKISAVFEFELLALITTSNLQDGQHYFFLNFTACPMD